MAEGDKEIEIEVTVKRKDLKIWITNKTVCTGSKTLKQFGVWSTNISRTLIKKTLSS